jgi:pyruvate ferredoxin oxidoreductase alpha subunit
VETHIVEHLAELINNGELDATAIDVESEHSAISAAIGVSATGSRVFTATSSQGLALMHEILFIASGMRMPIVMAVANRALSAPINIWNDQQDSISERDAGWIQFYCESTQEAVDTTIQAYKIAEDKNVLLPVMVCIDGFTLSHVYENVDMPEQKQVDSFLPKFKPVVTLDAKKPMTFGPIGPPDMYMELKQEQQNAILESKAVIKKVQNEFKTKFGRSYDLIEEYKTKDADTILIGMGTLCGTARVAIDEMRKEGKKVGMVKIRCFRPFPEEELVNVCKKAKQIAVVDRDMSYGSKGAVYLEVKDCLNDKKVKNYIMGLGGRDIQIKHIKSALSFKGEGVTWLN